VPYGWGLDLHSLNNTPALMLRLNLTYQVPMFYGYTLPYENYLHPLVFVGMFLPFIHLRWQGADPRLKALFVVLTPLVLLTSVLFSWLYESRNYVPLLPLLCTLALAPGRRGEGQETDAALSGGVTSEPATPSPLPSPPCEGERGS
jgi:hypothetical protein